MAHTYSKINSPFCLRCNKDFEGVDDDETLDIIIKNLRVRVFLHVIDTAIV